MPPSLWRSLPGERVADGRRLQCLSNAIALSTLPVATRSCLANLIASTHRAADDSLPSRDAIAAFRSAFERWAMLDFVLIM